MGEPHAIWERVDQTALVTLNRPDRMKAFLEKRTPSWSMSASSDMPEIEPVP